MISLSPNKLSLAEYRHQFADSVLTRQHQLLQNQQLTVVDKDVCVAVKWGLILASGAERVKSTGRVTDPCGAPVPVVMGSGGVLLSPARRGMNGTT